MDGIFGTLFVAPESDRAHPGILLVIAALTNARADGSMKTIVVLYICARSSQRSSYHRDLSSRLSSPSPASKPPNTSPEGVGGVDTLIVNVVANPVDARQCELPGHPRLGRASRRGFAHRLEATRKSSPTSHAVATSFAGSSTWLPSASSVVYTPFPPTAWNAEYGMLRWCSWAHVLPRLRRQSAHRVRLHP
ncbi:MAG: hypothetical protein ACLTQI_05020 [Slackia sp.]